MKPNSIIEQKLGRPIANISFALMHGYVHSAQRRGVGMMHTARPFSYYRKVFYHGQSRSAVLHSLKGKRVVDVGCGYTPYASDSMFRACHDAGIEFYGIDPLIGTDMKFGLKERMLARATGGRGIFNAEAPGLCRALSATAQELPFDDQSVDEILCSYLMFVWIEDEELLADIFKSNQKKLINRLLISLPLFAIAFVLTKIDFGIITENFDVPLGLNVNSINLDITDFTNQFYIQTVVREEFAFQIGAEHKFLKYSTRTLGAISETNPLPGAIVPVRDSKGRTSFEESNRE